MGLKYITVLLWNWSFLYYNCSERVSLPCTLFFYLHKANEQVKWKRDKLAPAKQSLTSHLNFPRIAWVVMNHTTQYLHWNCNKQGPMSHSSMLTIVYLQDHHKTMEGQGLDWSLNFSTYFKLCFCYAKYRFRDCIFAFLVLTLIRYSVR